ncbi:hypothetical protein PybrP1_011550 [[Pythium] brassicae (nom. inval.)]|nr:hypothetical protein PybrP1_011550 [[Pythium] brassicae (nom. inval.)]
MEIGGGGSNILRGGKRSYDCQTLIGNFVEEAYRPGAVAQRWDGGAAFETSTQQQMRGGVGAQSPAFGSALRRPDDPKYDYRELVGADKTRGASTWRSLASSTLCNSATPTEFAAPRELKGRRMPEDELVRHRKRWTNECADLVQARYATESSTTQDAAVNERFRKVLTRPTQVSYK